eukprot:TRINITY_DN44775_c0_g1_i1.p1 TRINITY_DN44775_c0_g1~~TRINITY_DN44775_c0_g1_i1.p1  ORF type:complete len:268 (+),score=124.31 TRINITY_DN44775_c0_g1_i1:51-854(+)
MDTFDMMNETYHTGQLPTLPPLDRFMEVGLYKLLIGVLFGLLVNTVFSMLFPHVSNGDPEFDRNPKWAWYSARVYQAVLMPICLAGLLYDKSTLSMDEMSKCSFANAGDAVCGSMVWEDLLLHVTTSYFIKDSLVMLRDVKGNIMYILHHIVCLLGNVVLFSFPRDAGLTAFAIGIVNLEFGSFIMCCSLLVPHCPKRFWVYAVVMTVSNFIATFILPTILFTYSTCDARQVGMVATSILLSYLRQDFLKDRYAEGSFRQPAKVKPE